MNFKKIPKPRARNGFQVGCAPWHKPCAQHLWQVRGMKHWGAMNLVGGPHEYEESRASGDILLWVTGSPGSALGQSCVLIAGTAYKAACYCRSEAMGEGHTWTVSSPGFFCGEEMREVRNGLSLWQCRLFPNELDLAT